MPSSTMTLALCYILGKRPLLNQIQNTLQILIISVHITVAIHFLTMKMIIPYFLQIFVKYNSINIGGILSLDLL